METKSLSSEQMEAIEGGQYSGQDISCAATNIGIIIGLATGSWGWVGAGLGIVSGIASGCYRRSE